MSKSTAEIVYEQSVRTIEQQVRQLDELRDRTAIVLATSGITTGFLARVPVERGLGAFGVFAVLAFAVSACCCIWVLLPRWDTWAFVISGKKLHPYFRDKDEPETADALFDYLGKQIETDYDENVETLKSLYKWFTWACVALTVEIVLWILALGLD